MRPWGLAVGDFNNDMRPDLAVASQADNNVSILLGNGMGGFSLAQNIVSGSNPNALLVGDWNGDMNLDFAVANQNSSNVSLLLGDGRGGFAAATEAPLSCDTTTFWMAAGDFNGDMQPDLAVTSSGSTSVDVFLHLPATGVLCQ